MTVIYLMRHSEPFKVENINNPDELQLQNEKWPLSIRGEELVRERVKDFKEIDVVYSSTYVRSVATAKYFSDTVYADADFGERKFGIKSWSEKPKDFYDRQLADFSYKIGDGESFEDVIIRYGRAIDRVLTKYKDKNVLVVGHSTAIKAYLLGLGIKKNKLLEGRMDYLTAYKLYFDDKEFVKFEIV